MEDALHRLKGSGNDKKKKSPKEESVASPYYTVPSLDVVVGEIEKDRLMQVVNDRRNSAVAATINFKDTSFTIDEKTKIAIFVGASRRGAAHLPENVGQGRPKSDPLSNSLESLHPPTRAEVPCSIPSLLFMECRVKDKLFYNKVL